LKSNQWLTKYLRVWLPSVTLVTAEVTDAGTSNIGIRVGLNYQFH
jgi:hypothetical protein